MTSSSSREPGDEPNKRPGEMMPKLGRYIVWSPTGETPPKVAHATHQAAHYAAQVMAKAVPGASFFVMKRSGNEIVASAIEAAAAGETRSGSTEGESVVPQADAHPNSGAPS